MTEEQIELKAREKYCDGCNRKIEQCVWAWRNVNGKTEPNEENCGCSEVPAYIAGATENGIQWHKVADGDLPKNEGFVCNQDGLPCWFDIKNDQWLDCEGTQIRTTEWCELPKFEE